MCIYVLLSSKVPWEARCIGCPWAVVTVNCMLPDWILWSKLMSSAKAVTVFNCWAISSSYASIYKNNMMSKNNWITLSLWKIKFYYEQWTGSSLKQISWKKEVSVPTEIWTWLLSQFHVKIANHKNLKVFSWFGYNHLSCFHIVMCLSKWANFWCDKYF